jgi:hypothetical protein
MPTDPRAGSEKQAGPGDGPWEDYATQLLKHLMHAKRVNYKELVGALRKIGVSEDPRLLTNRINRGKFPLVLFLQCVRALGYKLSDVPWRAFEDMNRSPDDGNGGAD